MRPKRYLTWRLGRIEAIMGNDGFAVGNQISLADVMLFSTLKDYLTEEEGRNLEAWQREPFTNKVRTNATVENYPKIKASVEKSMHTRRK
jgi:glutathione S-transferase